MRSGRKERAHRLEKAQKRLSISGPKKAKFTLWLHRFGEELVKNFSAPKSSCRPTKHQDIKVGEYIELVKTKADGNAKTLEAYAKAFRTIVAAICGIDSQKKFDYHKSGHRRWLAAVHSVLLAAITPAKMQAWKKAFLCRASGDPIAERRAKISINSLLRNTRSLFSPNIRRHLGVELPNPLPFEGVEFEPRPSTKYRSNFDVKSLIQKAQFELPENEPEQFKVFLLAVMAGLRRKEIDLLEWTAFRWDQNILQIAPTRYFHPKTEDSVGDLQLDPELVEIFRDFYKRASGQFVIESHISPRPAANYRHYRCQRVFEGLLAWLKKHDVTESKPLHALRKEYGSQINTQHGIHAASRALRHADIRVTNEYYTDSRMRVTLGMGHLLPRGPLEKITARQTVAKPDAATVPQEDDKKYGDFLRRVDEMHRKAAERHAPLVNPYRARIVELWKKADQYRLSAHLFKDEQGQPFSRELTENPMFQGIVRERSWTRLWEFISMLETCLLSGSRTEENQRLIDEIKEDALSLRKATQSHLVHDDFSTVLGSGDLESIGNIKRMLELYEHRLEETQSCQIKRDAIPWHYYVAVSAIWYFTRMMMPTKSRSKREPFISGRFAN